MPSRIVTSPASLRSAASFSAMREGRSGVVKNAGRLGVRGQRSKPPPHRSGRLVEIATFARIEDEIRLADDVSCRQEADPLHVAAVDDVVAIVAEQEEMTGRYGVERRVVRRAIVDKVERGIAHPIR